MDRKDVVATLNELIETCKDGEEGFLACAQKVTDPGFKRFFEEKALRCATGAVQLRDKVRELGGDPEQRGSTAGTLHRGWMHFKSSLVGMDDDSVLAECERGEDAAKGAYEKALRQDLPADVRQLVETQYREVKANHDRVHEMRDAAG
jgi:uncharacterized protein (TIGR02284 family)